MEGVLAPRPENEKGPWDVIIVGSGPSGLTAAVYTTRGLVSTLILGGEKWGGQLMLTTTVDNFPGFPEGIEGPDLMMEMRKQAERFGALFLEKNVDRVDFSKKPFKLFSTDSSYLAKSVIIATGAEIMWLGVPGERELIGKGISSCAPCDAPFFKDKNVAVIGGGDTAMEEALVLAKYAMQVTMIHRRSEFRASKAMQQQVLNHPKVKIIFNSEVIEFKGAEKLEKLVVKNNQTDETNEMDFDGAFVAIGHKPSSKTFEGEIDLDEKGYIKNKDYTKTNVDGVFVSGDIHDYTYRQAVTAAGFGCMAAMDALKYLEGLV